MPPESRFDILVVGAGHAGVEAALVAARSGLRTGLLTLRRDRVGHMPCNPAVGGPAKGHLVREVDALGGEIGRAADATYLQARWLNTRKGPSVRALRYQTDKTAYSRYMLQTLEQTPELTLLEGEAIDLHPLPGGGYALQVQGGEVLHGAALVLAPGTFLRGRCHTGTRQWDAGRRDEPPARYLTGALEALGFETRRLKTGTPPRISSRSIDYSQLRIQEGIEPPPRFSFLSPPGSRTQLTCWILRTTPETHAVIRRHLETCPLFSGQIEGTGPRYCPSIEDKVHRFPDRDSHPIFLEPEDASGEEIYVQGLSSSMDAEVQLEALRTLPGLEDVEMLRPGYAVEYDAVDARALRPTLESQDHPGLFLAGQICGTSGYEEAAGQGILAGLNAVRHLRGEGPFLLTRQEAYIGVMVDDLTTQGATEPYRMFTGRAEYRLLLRHDNADLRLTPRVLDAPHVCEQRRRRLSEKLEHLEALEAWISSALARPSPELEAAFLARGFKPLREVLPVRTVLRRPDHGLVAFAEGGLSPPGGLPEDPEAIEEAELRNRYAGYIERQTRQIEQVRRFEGYIFPDDFDIRQIPALSYEGRLRLLEAGPATLGQASRIPGVRAADLAVLAHHLRKRQESEHGDR